MPFDAWLAAPLLAGEANVRRAAHEGERRMRVAGLSALEKRARDAMVGALFKWWEERNGRNDRRSEKGEFMVRWLAPVNTIFFITPPILSNHFLLFYLNQCSKWYGFHPD